MIKGKGATSRARKYKLKILCTRKIRPTDDNSLHNKSFPCEWSHQHLPQLHLLLLLQLLLPHICSKGWASCSPLQNVSTATNANLLNQSKIIRQYFWEYFLRMKGGGGGGVDYNCQKQILNFKPQRTIVLFWYSALYTMLCCC